MFSCDVVVIGGGAAGLMSAMVAGQRGRRVVLIEHAKRVGKKILMSGGGRCNFTNLYAGPDNYLSSNPHFCKSALARYTPADFIALVERHRIAYHEKELGQLFCDESSKDIVRMLLSECETAGVNILTECAVRSVESLEGDGFVIDTARGRFQTESLVIASGGLSIPKMGATGFGYALARQFGLSVVDTRAGLVPLTLSGTPLEDWEGLPGIAIDAAATANGTDFRGGLLWTHRGFSGPSILQISSYWKSGDTLHLNLLPELDAADDLLSARRDQPRLRLRQWLDARLPGRLAQRLCARFFEDRPLAQLRDAALREIGQQLNAWPIVVSGTEGYRTAEVTLGGVDTRELSSSTMESRRVPGLYFVGEVVDVTGWLGGYNFQWAWASAQAAGAAV
ncbi:NAD(P)/FAD-dependent oxidoreductase [Algiphilus sp. W345]|uniref:NAD(P)/FAD-dependent oxidoreductase n=2 Tax=Banduia mediterranea TaxID=3075609 RepID=A0ABU2WLZ5_9GAMM|nr:NAD(P)/FAD-dependent oxidoreductase [Algiphilus sp. W345]MDT0498904.1 NAD(P)/FAD-dependent oxidoreductase [Algiphilus sp. W345]